MTMCSHAYEGRCAVGVSHYATQFAANRRTSIPKTQKCEKIRRILQTNEGRWRLNAVVKTALVCLYNKIKHMVFLSPYLAVKRSGRILQWVCTWLNYRPIILLPASPSQLYSLHSLHRPLPFTFSQ